MKLLNKMSLCATALCLASAANAQTTTGDMSTPAATPAPAMTAMDTAPAMPSMNAMPVSGTVLRYYVDRSGFVSAMDVQTTEGTRMVRFSPSLAQKLTMMYPVGSTASVFITSSTMNGMTRYDLAGAGPTMPVPGAMMMPVTVTDLDVLKSVPQIMVGSKPMTFKGKLDATVTDSTGEVLALILDMDGKKGLVRVPLENRLITASSSTEGITSLYPGAMVSGSGYEEAPRYGIVSPYDKRVVANNLVVDRRSVGALGFGRRGTMIGKPMISGTPSAEETNAGMMGYNTYMAPAMMAPDSSTTAPGDASATPATSPTS